MPVSQEHFEPWLRGRLEGVPLAVMPLFFCFANVREDLRRHVADLTTEEIWKKVGRNAAVGFHLRHIFGSVDRLLTYLEGGQLTEEQLEFLSRESAPGASFDELFTQLDRQLTAAEQRLMELDTSDLNAVRYVGRARLEVTFLGLLIHIAEHTQRHLGQAITTAKLVRL
ncbi:MAG: DinB family protein [Bryobacteraceae bacterium]